MRRALSAFALALLASPLLAQEAAPVPRVPISPRAAEEIAVGPGKMRVEYGRPFARGRKIFGGLVPWGKVWRTGANAATTLVTDVDVTLGGVVVPKGTWTLYTLPGEKEWKLIVNRQTGQWGTDYKADRDLVRVPLQVGSVATPVERFTIALEPGAGNAATLVLTWDTTRLSAPIIVK